jgi:flagellar M-ring protein FliF
VLVVLFVLRPLTQQVTATLREPMLLPTGATNALEGQMEIPPVQAADEEVLLPWPKNKEYQLQQGIFEHVSEHIRREPAQSTRLLEAWIGSPEEMK